MIRVVIVLCAVVFTVLASCKQDSAPEHDTGVLRESSIEGLSLSVYVSRDELTTSEMLNVAVVVRSDESLKVKFPEFNESTGMWGEFFIFESKTTPAKLDTEGMVVVSRLYVLEPDIPAESVLPGLTVKAITTDGKSIEVTTQPIEIEVMSVITDGENKMQDIAPNDRPSSKESTPGWLVAFIIVNMIVVFAVLVFWLIRKKQAVVVQDHLHRDFEELRSAPDSEIMRCIERVVCRVLAYQQELSLAKVDFAGLQEALDEGGSQIVGLSEAVSYYERLQYASHLGTGDQVGKIYAEFATIIEEQAKEVNP